jgi:hypothetical protein
MTRIKGSFILLVNRHAVLAEGTLPWPRNGPDRALGGQPTVDLTLIARSSML